MRRKIRLVAVSALAVGIVGSGCRTFGLRTHHNAQASVRAIIDQQMREWNAGNLAGFMETYDKSEQTRFGSGGDISCGWQTVFDRYKTKYKDRAAMGTLSLTDLEITSLGPNTAEVFGRWHLQRAGDSPSGLFTLLFRKTPEGWRIVHDHTSSAIAQ